MLKKIFAVLAFAVAVFLVVVALQPADFRITRSTVIAAPAGKIFSQVNDLHQWDGWSPWAKLDPNAKNSFEGPKSGVGAVMRWAGNMDVGEGSMTIVESRSPEFIKFRLDFLKPMASTSNAEFTFTEEKNQTSVTWTMYGTNNFVGKAMGLIFNCEKMVGGQFEKGLASLKSLAEAKK